MRGNDLGTWSMTLQGELSKNFERQRSQECKTSPEMLYFK